MDKPLLCKDCKHYAPNSDGGNCNAPQNYPTKIDYVNGGIAVGTTPLRYYRAQATREDLNANSCGPNGNWWSAK